MFKFYSYISFAIALTFVSHSLNAEITYDDLLDAIRYSRSCPAEAYLD